MNPAPVRRLRMFAGPNGSGKSTIKAQVNPRLWGHYINPDELQRELQSRRSFDFSTWNIEPTVEEVRDFLLGSWLAKRPDWDVQVDAISLENNRLLWPDDPIDPYISSALSDFLRRRLLANGKSFTFETVMSSRDKVDFLAEARALGYRTYLYFVATNDPLINVSRVVNRVQNGGHDVPHDKIIERYTRSLQLLVPAIRASNRAFIWDNSGTGALLLAEFENGRGRTLQENLPAWFQTFVLDKLSRAPESGVDTQPGLQDEAKEEE